MRIENLDKLRRFIRNLGRLPDLASKAFAEEILSEAVEKAPKRSGRLRRSIRLRRRRSGYEVSMGGSEAPYAPYVEYGSRPHLIRARRSRALRFEVRGQLVYAKYVEHPGAKPQRILASAISAASRNMRDVFGRLLEEI